VPRHKQTRKQRAASSKAAAKMATRTPVKKNFLTNSRARFSAYLWAISLTFCYGILNDLVLDRPTGRVNMEALVVCILTLVAKVLFYYERPARAYVGQGIPERLWIAIQQLSQRKTTRLVGVSSFTFVLVLSAAPIGGVEPAIAARHLEKSDIGLIPGLDSDLRGTEPAYRFREVTARIEKTIKERAPGDPATVSEVRDSLANVVQNVRLPENVSEAAKLELAYLQSYETLSRIGVADPQILHQISSGYTPGIPAVIGAGVDKTTFIMAPPASEFTEQGLNPIFFSGFTVISFGHNPGSPVPQFAVTKVDSTAVVFNDIKIEGLAQDIGNFTWTNVTFQGCLIRYHGQRLRMGNVRFINCTFERSLDGQQLLDYLSSHQGESVSAYVP
jgi:hypothetical protein